MYYLWEKKAAQSGLADVDYPHDIRKDAPRKDMDTLDHGMLAKIHNLKNPQNKIENPKPLGSGAYGTVLPSAKGVTKFDKSSTEARLFKRLPNRLKTNKVLPQDVKTGSVRIPNPSNRVKELDGNSKRTKVSTISREDLKDAPWGLTDHIGRLNTHLGAALQRIRFNRIPIEQQRSILQGSLNKWHHDMKNDERTDNDSKSKLSKFASGIARLLHHGVIPGDLHNKNIGNVQMVL